MSDQEEFDPFSDASADEPTDVTAEEFAAGQADSSPAASIEPAEADEDEEPPEPEGKVITADVKEALGTQDAWGGPIPYDVAAVWCHTVAEEVTCRILLAAWGLDGFRASTLHKAALQDVARLVEKAEATQAFKAERQAKTKGKR
jgi:hypothetical protein